MRIREADDADAERLFEMCHHFLHSTAYGGLVKTTPMAIAQLITFVLTRGVVVVAEVEGTLQGMLALVALPHPFSGDLYGDEIVWWVEPGFRKSSIGPRLLEAGEAWAIAHSLTLLKMVAPAHSTVGDFYERLGYEEVETAYQKRLPQ